MVVIPLWFRIFVRKVEYLFVETKNELCCCWRVSKCHVTSTALFSASRWQHGGSLRRKLGPRPRTAEGTSLLVPRRLSLFSFILPTVFTTFLSTRCTNSGRLTQQKLKDQEGHGVCQFFCRVHIRGSQGNFGHQFYFPAADTHELYVCTVNKETL
jgi:hypothetical protein